MIITIDGKLHHLQELDFIERQLYKLVSPESFYNSLVDFIKKNVALDKDYYTYEEAKAIDNFVQGYFANIVDDARIWFLRAYIIGRILASTDLQGQEFNLGVELVNKMPKFIQEAAKQYNLSVEEVAALNSAIERGAGLISNTTTNTQNQVKDAIFESLQRREGLKGVENRLKETLINEVGELNRDWQRVAITETNIAFANGYLSMMNEGEYVIGISMPDACPHCKELIHLKVYRVLKEAPPDYSNLSGEEYNRIADIWENYVWEGKNNVGRSTSLRKRIDKTKGNRKDNLVYREHHEISMPVIPLHPHCFKGDVEIYTQEGWRRFDELERGVKVATFNMQTETMEYQLPYEYIEYEYNGEMIRLYSKNVDIECTSEHKILTGKRPNKSDRQKIEYKLIPANQLSGEIIIPISCKYENKEKKSIQIGRHILDEITYARLMGYYLSEGNCKSKKHGWEVKISQYKQSNIEIIYEHLKSLDVNLRKYKHSIQFNDKDLCSYLMQFGKSYEKYIPQEIKNLSKEGIKAFLDAYVLGDGNIRATTKLRNQKNPSISKTISTTSKRLADDLTEIIMKAGYSVSYTLKKTKGKEVKFRNGKYKINHDLWVITIKTSKFITNVQRSSSEYQGRVYCVSVPNETILVRSNGKVLWIGNCRCRWVAFNPELQFVDDGEIKLKVENPEKHKQWYEEHILGYGD